MLLSPCLLQLSGSVKPDIRLSTGYATTSTRWKRHLSCHKWIQDIYARLFPVKFLYSIFCRIIKRSSFLKASAPETGEDFQLVADDYQRLIIPGTSDFFLQRNFTLFKINRSYPLAAPLVLWLFPRRRHIRRYSSRSILYKYTEPRLQCEFYTSDIIHFLRVSYVTWSGLLVQLVRS